ncbi:MAG: YidC/Oxa1 family rane protein insertase [Thermomicrobiales bacterium]|nr:YidC/Oxa1 family rane protein insertase [Thermomicrobiales bacterium]
MLGNLVDLSGLTGLLGVLAGLQPHLTDLTPLFPSPPGWNAYVDFLERTLDFLARTLNSGGLAVIAFTVIVKTLLLPLTVTSIRSSKAMQELQPKIKELQKKYGKDRARLSQETMKLYQTHRVNPMAGCLPMIIQIPIFFGVYRAINNLSNGQGFSGASDIWANNFLWLNSLSDADPWHVLPIAAAVFQFIQTKMMRPAGQGKITDPQQAMMNQMMNFMPITVILFGWSFASGPVIYWVTQSVYSVVQQWFITGWGSMRDWVPSLPELPEHRRLGYRPPRNLDDVVVMSGEDAPKQGGVMGWFNAKMQQAQEQQATRAAARTGSGSGSDLQRKVDEVTERTGPKPPRPVKKEARAASRREGTATGNGTSSAATGAKRAGANGQASRNGGSGPPIVPRKSRRTRKRDTPVE